MTEDHEPDEGEWPSGYDADHTIEVEVSDNPVVATLLGPDGEVLIELRERSTIFGFARWRASS